MEQLSIRLSQAEFALLVELAGATTIPSLGSEPYRTSDADQIALMRNAAVQSLFERRLITADASSITTVDQVLKGAILTCVYPQSLLSLFARYPAEEMPRFEAYYAIPDLAVHHQPATDGLHQLTVFGPAPDFQALIAERLSDFTVETGSRASLSLPLEAFNAIQRAARVGDTDTIARQIGGYVEGDARAPALVAAFARPLLRWVLERNADGHKATFACLVAESGSWIIQGLANSQGQPLALVPMTGAALEEYLDGFFAASQEQAA